MRQRVTLAGRETRSVFLNIDPEVAQRVERAAVTGEVLEPISSFPACATEPIWAQFETTNAAVYLTYTRRATVMKCAQVGPSPSGRRQDDLEQASCASVPASTPDSRYLLTRSS